MKHTKVGRWRLGSLVLTIAFVPRLADADDLQKLDFNKSKLPTKQMQGRPVDGIHWNDSLGENLLVVTQTGAMPSKKRGSDDDSRDAELYAYHFIKKGTSWNILWKIQDFEKNCSFDLHVGLLPRSLSLTDLDSDGTAETSFLYKLTCRSDVSPSKLKLIMHEGDKKFAIRGNTKLPPEMFGGESHTATQDNEMKLDPLFAAAPSEFKTYAIKRWEEFVVEKTFD